jgi:hypothetical protein
MSAHSKEATDRYKSSSSHTNLSVEPKSNSREIGNRTSATTIDEGGDLQQGVMHL